MTDRLSQFLDDRPIRPGTPRSETVIEVTPKYLIYDGTRTHDRKYSRGMLRELLEAKDSPMLITRFCEKWGVLGVCKHGLPRIHTQRCWWRKPFRTSMVKGFTRNEYKESFQSIQQFANGIESLMRIGAEISQGREGIIEDWQTAQTWLTRWQHPDSEDEDLSNPKNFNLKTRRLYLEIYLNRLIDESQLRPRVYWPDGISWRIEMDSGMSMGHVNNLAALVVMELLMTVANCDGLANCAACNRPYIPERRPDSTRRNYCPSCGRKAAVRDASREYRQRRREAVNADQISPALNKTKKGK